MEKVIPLILLILGFANAITVKRTSCPEVKTVDNFNLESLTQGKWYVLGKYANDLENLKNVVVYKGDVSDDKFKLKLDYPETVPEYVETEFSLAENFDKTGDVILKAYFGQPRRSISLKTKFILYDTDNFAIVYYCKYSKQEKATKEYAWIASRSLTPEPAVKEAMEEFIENSEYLDFDKFEWLSPYEPQKY